MLFHTLPFAIFLAVTIAFVAVARGATARKVILLLASYTFYGWWSVPLLAPLLFTTFLDYFIAQAIEAEQRDARRRTLLIVSLTANLGLLGFFKYYDFFASTIGAPVAGVLLPIGISFYTFHTMSYTIDVYRREIPASRSPLDFALFIAFFPVLVAGPILRAKQFLPQLQQQRVTLQFSPSILFLFLRGLAKKVLVADNVARLVDNVFYDPSPWPSVVIWIATLGFAVQIYCDFSGYSDMARALARLFGFEIPLNFDHPYAAANPREFWRRWHISLSTWLRDYLYIPLGGNRHHHIRNLMITMILGGLWHGASWNFVLWGAMHGLLLALGSRMPRVLFYYSLLLTWIAFRVRDFDAMFLAMRKFVFFDFDFDLAHLGLTGLFFLTTIALIATFFALHAWSARRGDLDERLARLPFAAQAAACALLGAALVLFWPNENAPFIYFQF